MSEISGDSPDKFDRFAEARSYGEYYGIPQSEGEADEVYRDRVAGELRRIGKVIEAHEVASGRRWDDPEQGPAGPLAGIIGATAQAIQGIQYSPTDPVRQIGDDIAAGIVATHRDRSADVISALFDLIGPEAGMDVIESLTRNDRD